MLKMKPLTSLNLSDLEKLFTSDKSAKSCWCMWFIIAVKEFHAGGSAANEAKFKALAKSSAHPMGLIAYLDGEPVGWAAAGPRSRYARALKTPTMKTIDQSENDAVWLVPCFFIRPDMRGRKVTQALLEAAVQLARKSKAPAIEGFPTAGSKLGSVDRQVATEHIFESCGFHAISRPSANRALMRLDFRSSGRSPA
jgi:GNAT superfamily N-acetyltransferase